MRRECRKRFPRHQRQRKPLVSDTGMHHGTHVPWCMSGSLTRGGGENVPCACAARNFAYLVRGPYTLIIHNLFVPTATLRAKAVSTQRPGTLLLWCSIEAHYYFLCVLVCLIDCQLNMPVDIYLQYKSHDSVISFPFVGRYYIPKTYVYCFACSFCCDCIICHWLIHAFILIFRAVSMVSQGCRDEVTCMIWVKFDIISMYNRDCVHKISCHCLLITNIASAWYQVNDSLAINWFNASLTWKQTNVTFCTKHV